MEKTKVMGISRQTSAVTIMLNQTQLESVECFKYLGSMLTNDGRRTCEIKCRIAMAKATFNNKKNLFTSTLDLELRRQTTEWNVYIFWGHIFLLSFKIFSDTMQSFCEI